MKLKLTPKFALTFLALAFVMHEAHEIVHTTVGRIICGCWGQRDFNVWGVCESCDSNPLTVVATFAGPIFTFILIWIGTFLIESQKSEKQKAFGFSLIFANMPFARIITAIFGGGDEVFGLNKLLKNHPLAWSIGLTFILVITIFPLYKSFKLIDNKNRIWWFLLFFIVPTFMDGLVILGGMNNLLKAGFLREYWILGSPILVTLWTASVLIIYLLTKKNIYELTRK